MLALLIVVMVVFALIDLVATASSYAVIHLASRQASFKAATAENIDSALFEMQNAVNGLADSGLGRFAHLKPVGGYNGCGADLFINVTQVSTGTTTQIGPNKGIPRPPGSKQIDSDVNIYECAARLTYEMGPLVPLTGIPWIKDIPGCGKPATMQVSTNIALEEPERLAIGASGDPNSGNNAPPGTGITPGSGTNPGGFQLGGWNYPTPVIFVLLPGQRIIQQNDVIVTGRGPAPYDPVDSNNWHDTGIDVGPDQRVSVAWNFFAMGAWTHGNPRTIPPYDADGFPNGNVTFGLNNGVMVGRVSKTGELFRVGKNYQNYSPVETGRLYLRLNDGALGFYDNEGQQKVTVFLTN
ncbi:MAG: hypothetical protein JST89_25265 [Cyanobacteria bacterium SZAS-4]|nr:hypothetical protein [Cyanobacteria bacterium SZAS-4]